MSQQALNLGDRNSNWENPNPFFNERKNQNGDYKFVKVDNRLEYVIDYEIEQSWTY